ncbi:murein biosynthesis integral membrane protein MurJ [Adlercreutzia sp. ZJ141]|uniref:murein biosynthesis integral membrane protein MurJ n=1 Tax=Adlercreutzia sp. ZJ141 TaxID=2709406 RepID=UPI0013EAA4C5|nr:murein biosynthesis integral membrane protein MurJ [Adlercreutzia sp. ZJ141]
MTRLSAKPSAPNARSASSAEVVKPADDVAAVGSSAALISVCVLVSRITGFLRTWAMAFALGATLLSSSYQVANTLPNMLYEMVVGGMLVTAFLPVYMSVKKRLGNDAGNDYASNLLTIVVVLLGAASLLCMVFPGVVIYTQSFLSDQAEMAQSVFFFQFFAIQIVFYGISAILSGLLNANRDYLWSSIAPVANNLIVIVTFVAYAALAPRAPEVALYIIAIGNPAGVIVQALMQWPALKRNGIRLRPRINLHDPALRETVSIGVPAVFVMLCSFVVVSVQNAASYAFTDSGPSIIAYSRLWFTLPYAFLAVPITTTMFTELSDMQAEGNIEGVKRGIVSGTNQILFFMIPFALYLAVFSLPLVTLYHVGAFSLDSVSTIASFLAVFAVALPFYAVFTYMQKVCSSLRIMHLFAAFNVLAGAAQIVVTLIAASRPDVFPIETIALAEGLFYFIGEACVFVYLRRRFGGLGMRSTARATCQALLFGGLGAAAAAGVLYALQLVFGPLSGSISQAFLYIVVGGLVALVVTFGPAMKLGVPEAAFVSNIAGKVAGRFAHKAHRGRHARGNDRR